MATAIKAPVDAGEYRVVAISTIEVEKGFNNRRSLGDLSELAESIRSLGLLEPLIVWEPNGHDKLRLIAGERRLAASKQVGLKQIPVIVRTLDDKARLEALLVENLHRKDLDPLEEADGYKRLVDLGLRQADIAKKVGRSEAHISKRLALAGLSALASKLLSAGTIPIDAAIGLAKHKPEIQDRAIEHVKKNYGKLEDAAPYQLRNLGDRAREEAKKVERSSKRAELKKKLRASGVVILSAAQSYHWGEPGQPWRVGGKKGTYEPRGGRVDMTPKEHSAFACHAAAITSPQSIYDHAEPSAIYLCTDAKAHMTKEQAAAFDRKKKVDAQDSYEAKRRLAEAVRKEIKEARESRMFAIREALRSTDQQMLAVLALESFVMSANLEALAELLGLPAGKAAKEKSVADYCNASHANLVRAAAAAAICIGERAIADAAESQAGGYYHDRGDFPRAIAVAEWFKQVGIVLTDVETKALEKATKKEKS